MKLDSFNKIRENMKRAADAAGMRARFFVDQHARLGKFRNGPYANKGYSTNTIPVFFLGEFDGTNVRNYATTVRLLKKNIEWRKSKKTAWGQYKGKSTAYYTKGYKGFRKRSGRDVSTVDLTFSGEMLRNTIYRWKNTGIGITIEILTQEPYNQRMVYTNQQREWMYLSKEERTKIAIDVVKTLVKDL